MKNKILSALLILCFSMQGVVFAEDEFSARSAEASPIDEPWQNNGFIPQEEPSIDFTHTDEYIWADIEPFAPYDTEVIPEEYDAVTEGLVTTPKNQGIYGTCWAFATISAIETYMIKTGYAEVDDIDYSERHLAYFAHTPNTFTGDGQTTYDEYGYYGGGNYLNATFYLSGWQGAALEKNFPFLPREAMDDLTEADRYTSNVHLQNYYQLSASDVKSAVLEYGSVPCAYYDNTKYHTSTNAYYQNKYNKNYSNHAVTIVGWDDNYALENFSELESQPQSAGAWKIKNSWGSDWGDGGYFWISYEDASICNFVVITAEPTDNYQLIHQYDGADSAVYTTIEKSANIFTAEEAQTLKAVGFFTTHGNSSSAPVEYTASIYLLESGHSTPESGALVSTASGVAEYDGYHTIELDTPVGLRENDEFSVVLSLKNPSGTNAYHVFESGSDYYSSNEGESYFYNGSWTDTTQNSQINNARIKAYSTVEPATVHFDTNGGSTIADITAAKYILLEIPAAPEKSGFYFAGWFKDAECSEAWDFDTDKITEDITLYAKWSETPITAESISINGDEYIYTGNTANLSVTITPYYTTDKTLTWSSSGDGLSVSDGMVTALTKGSYTVTAELSDGTAATIDITVCERMGTLSFAMDSPIYSTSVKPKFAMWEENASTFELYVLYPNGSLYGWRLSNPGFSFYITPTTFTTEGTYYAYAVAYDPLGNSVKSHTQTFLVTDSPTLFCASYSDGLKIGAYNGSDTSQVILGYYDDGRLTKTEVYSDGIFGKLKAIPYDYSNSELKIMWWDSLTGLSPITEAISLTEYDGNFTWKQ